MATRVKKGEVPPLNGDVFPASDGPALQFVALDAIESVEQVRTQFDDATLAELADDIKANGVLQPVLLRPVGEGRYRFIAGERRIRAARMAGLSAVPALVGDVSDEHAEDMQLAENIQREDLSLQDEARAVRRLYDRLGKVDRVAQRVHKSAAWVSKRLALTYGDFDLRAMRLLQDGVTEDIELLQCVAKIGPLDLQAAVGIDHAIREGTAGRKEARALLAKLKKLPQKPKRAEPETTGGAGASESEGRSSFHPSVMLWELVDVVKTGAVRSIAEVVSGLSADQQQAVLDVCRDDYECGAGCAGLDGLALVRRIARLHAREHLEDWTFPAFSMGAFGMDFDLCGLLSEISLAVV